MSDLTGPCAPLPEQTAKAWIMQQLWAMPASLMPTTRHELLRKADSKILTAVGGTPMLESAIWMLEDGGWIAVRDDQITVLRS